MKIYVAFQTHFFRTLAGTPGVGTAERLLYRLVDFKYNFRGFPAICSYLFLDDDDNCEWSQQQ